MPGDGFFYLNTKHMKEETDAYDDTPFDAEIRRQDEIRNLHNRIDKLQTNFDEFLKNKYFPLFIKVDKLEEIEELRENNNNIKSKRQYDKAEILKIINAIL